MSPETITLADQDAGSSASILTLGFNCYRFQTAFAGEPVDVLWSAPNFAAGTERASGSGIPILFPFPGRIQGVDFEWEGKTYHLQPGDKFGNAIHGFVHTRLWRVVEQTGTRVVGVFQASVDDPSLVACWPADFRITASYELSGSTLRSHFRLENPDPTNSLPCGFGTHPYFRVPLGIVGNALRGVPSADECRIRIPARERWKLVDMLVTGEHEPIANVAAFHSGLRFGDTQFDDCFTDLRWNGDECRAQIADPASGRTMTMTFSRAFRECVVYNPPHREAICIEPLTCPPDPFRLSKLGVDAGLRVLAPGEFFEAHVELCVA
jgi:aldose 1-epimerase